MSRISDDELRRLLDAAMPAMDGLKRVSSGEWSVDYDDDCASQFIGREDGCPVIAIMEPGWGSDRRMDAIEALCIAAPQLAAEVLQLRATLSAITATDCYSRDECTAMARAALSTPSPVVAKEGDANG